ncbi:MAG: hypothetical protein ACQETL_03750 [Bacteroidota bacterium]
MKAPNHRHKVSAIENAQLKDLFLAIYFNDLEKVKAFQRAFPALYQKKRDFYLYLDLPLDLVQLTFLNQKVWGMNDWRKEIFPFVKMQRAKTEKMLAHWKSEFNTEELVFNLKFNQYHELFDCDDPKYHDTVILDSMEDLIKKGYRKLDLQLYNRVDCFDFEAVKALLENGAKTNIHFYEDNDSSVYTRVLFEISHLATNMVVPEFEAFEKMRYDQNFHLGNLAGELIGLVAHEEMYELLKPYLEEDEYKEKN